MFSGSTLSHRLHRAALIALPLALTASAFAQDVRTIYVSPDGDDEFSGSQSEPLQSVFAALNLYRSSRSDDQTVIEFSPGHYSFDRKLWMGEADSGTFGTPLVFRGEQGVFFDASVSVKDWQRVTGGAYIRLKASARDKVFVAPVPMVEEPGMMGGDEPLELGSISQRGKAYQTQQTWSTLIFNDNEMGLAKFPNDGWLYVPQNHNGSSTSFASQSQEPFGWVNTGDIWTYGYLAWDWADSFQRVSRFDSQTGRTHLATEPHYGVRSGQRYALVNALEALDMPGEYFIDRMYGAVYFFPPLEGLDETTILSHLESGVTLTSLDQPMVETLNVHDVTFENITFQNGRRNGAVLRGGARIAFKGCTFRHFNHHAVVVMGGTDHSFHGCDFHDLAESALLLSGGDRASLTPSGHVVSNCWFRDYAQLCRAYRPAIDVWGVGHRISNCRIEDAPHSGIILRGNDNIVEYNEFARLCTDTNDSGAVYIGRNPTYHGNKVRYNRFSDLWSNQSGNWSNFVAGVYLDDMSNGTEVTMNVFERCQIGTIVGGGRDNDVTNNFFFESGKGVWFDARGTSWASDFFSMWNWQGKLNEVPYQSPVWANAYPNLPGILNDDPQSPKRNTLTKNVFVGSTDWLQLLDGLTPSSRTRNDPPIYAKSNYAGSADPGFSDTLGGDYDFGKKSTLSRLKVKAIDTSLMGLYLDEFRSYVPAGSGGNSNP